MPFRVSLPCCIYSRSFEFELRNIYMKYRIMLNYIDNTQDIYIYIDIQDGVKKYKTTERGEGR